MPSVTPFAARRLIVVAFAVLAAAWLGLTPASDAAASPSPLASPILSLATFASPLHAVKPGGKIVYTIVVSNTGQTDATDTIVRSTLPPHTRFVTTTSTFGRPTFVSPLRPGDPVEWSFGTLAANGAQRRTITFVLTVLRETPAETLIHFESTARAANAASVSKVRTHVVGRDVGSVSPGAGGSLDLGGILVAFPPAAVTQTVNITYTALSTPTANTPAMRVVGRAFTLDASDLSGHVVNHFAQPYTLTLNYANDELAGGLPESQLNVYFYNTTLKRWVAIMPCAGCSLNTSNNTITVVLDHFTEFALGSAFKVYVPGLMRSP